MVVEQAGGSASTGTHRILDIQPESLLQKVPLIIGSREDVAEYIAYCREG
jgi:fructose-1,6-bisphosphatase I